MKRLILATTTAAAFLAIACAAFARQADSAAPLGMVRVEGGTFTMGSAAPFDDCRRFRAETPARRVTVSGFWIGRFPVTQGEWYDAMGTRPSRFTGEHRYDDDWSRQPVTGVNWRNLPVESVSWYDAVEFANAMSVRAGLAPAYGITGPEWNRAVTWNRGANGYRLPTEAEWEFAARGGIACRGNFEFSGSHDAAEVAWTRENSGGRTHEVGTRRANALGIYDMGGNVWEWVWDRFDAYPGEAETDPAGAPSGSDRALRGGSWNESAAAARSAFRLGRTPLDGRRCVGFRLARSP